MDSCNATDEKCVYSNLLYDLPSSEEWVWIVFVVVMICIFVVGLIGNLLTCVVIYCDKSMHTVTNYYLFHLAVSDIIGGFGVLSELYDPFKYDDYSEAVCRVHFFFVVTLWNNSILIMTALAVERYVAIWHPLLVNRKPVWRRVKRIMYMIWAVAIIEALPQIWTTYLVKTKSAIICFTVPTMYARLVNGIMGLVTFIFPLGIMTFVYAMVAFKVHMSQKSYTRDNIFNHRTNSSKVNRLVSKSSCLLYFHNIFKLKEGFITNKISFLPKMFGIIMLYAVLKVALTLSFLVCWLPFFTLRVLVVASNWTRTSWFLQHWELLLILCSVNSWFSIVLNPMLFSLMSTKFRTALKAQWNTKCRRQTPTPTTDVLAL